VRQNRIKISFNWHVN